MKILHLTLKKKWFDMIASGEKKEEYRELKPYWRSRLLEYTDDDNPYVGQRYRHFDIVRFKNGYSKTAPTIDVEFIYTRVTVGLPHLGAEPGEKYYVIKLGKVLPKSLPTVQVS